jgi:hypothetical protein
VTLPPPPEDFNPYQAPQSQNLDVVPNIESPDGLQPVPWEQEAEIPSWWDRVVATVKLAFKKPMEFADRVPVTQGFAAPLKLAVLASIPVAVLASIGILISSALQLGVGALGSRSPFTSGTAFAGLGVGVLAAVYLVLLPCFAALGVLLGGCINHACLWVLGGTKQQVGLEQSIRLAGYVLAINYVVQLPAQIPLLGGCVGVLLIPLAIAIMVYHGMGLARIHRTDTWRGVCAVFLPIIVCCCLLVPAIFILVGAIGSNKFHF